MVETHLRLKKGLGIVLIIFGVFGFAYILWIYKGYANQLPKFPNNSVLLTQGVSIYSDGVGFAGLNSQTDIITPEAPDLEDQEANNSLTINRSTEIVSATEPNYNTAQLSISIPRLGIEKAKVALDVDGNDERIYNGILTKAIAHLKKSAYPGQFGNVFIFGHSRLPVLSGGGGYASIFTDLPQI
jgi:sortase (surface protein transpeptidase)